MSVGFFEEISGNKSSMRLMSFIALISAIIFGIITVNKSGQNQNKDDTGIYITFGFLLSAFAPKALQKFAERIPQSSQLQAIEQFQGQTQASQLQASQLQASQLQASQLQASQSQLQAILEQLQASQIQAKVQTPLHQIEQVIPEVQTQTAAQRLKALSQRGL
jgi:hypothetical protein